MTAALEQALAGPLRALTDFRRFLVYKVVPDPKRPGKTNKFPVDPSGAYVDAATQCLSWQEAMAAMPRDGAHGVGFYFAEADGFWFLDVDGAWSPDEGWSPLVGQLDALLPGAAREVSHSGTGLHYFGRGPVPAHRCRDVKGDGLEFYTGRRFVALTGTHASGSAAAEPVEGVARLVAEWFPPLAAGGAGHDGAGPRDDWQGPDDDDELVALIEASHHRLPGFGESGPSASDAELWRGDVAALSELYPETDPSKARPFDATKAGWALSRALAYWTGCDLERMERLLWRAPFMEVSQWDAGKAYRSLRRRVATWPADRKVLQRGEPQAVVVAPSAPSAPALPLEAPARGTLLYGEGMAQLFRGCVYVLDRHSVLTPQGHLLGPQEFGVLYSGYDFVMRVDNAGSGAIKSDAFKAFTEAQTYSRVIAATTVFDPREPLGALIEREGRLMVNTYRDVQTPRKAGDASPFLDLLRRMLPDERDRTILLSWAAALVQYRGRKFQWWPVIQGWEGNGKSLFTDVLAHAVGECYTARPRIKDIENKFNAWMQQALLAVLDDTGKRAITGEVLDMVKPMVTGRIQNIEKKGQDSTPKPVFFNGVITTNFQDTVVVEDGTRRFAVFFCAQQKQADMARDGLTEEYFKRYLAWLTEEDGFAIAHDYLATYAIPAEFNPAEGCTRAPATSSMAAAIEAGLSEVERRAVEMMDGGEEGFRGGWFNVSTYRHVEGSKGLQLHALYRRLEANGYVPHPALESNGGRTRDNPPGEFRKARLWIKASAPEANWKSVAEVTKAYSEAQKLAIGFGNSGGHLSAVQ